MNKTLLFKKLSFYAFFLLRILSIIIDYIKEEYYTYSVFETAVDITSLIFGLVFVILFFICRKNYPAQTNDRKKSFLIVFLVLSLTIINGYVLGFFFEPIFDTIGINVNAYSHANISDLKYDSEGNLSLTLNDGTIIHTETTGKKTSYLLEDETLVFSTEKQNTVSFYPQKDKLYYTVSHWKDCLATKYGCTSSLIHNCDILYCYDFTTGKSESVYTTAKNERILYADGKITVLFDITEKSIFIKETYTDKITYTDAPLPNFNNSFLFETNSDSINIHAFEQYTFKFDSSAGVGSLTSGTE